MRKKIIILIGILSISMFAFSQEKKQVTPQSANMQGGMHNITGKVVDEKGDAVIGASVKVKGSKVGTISDASGRFSLSTQSDATLVLSYIGYVSQEVSLNGRSSIAVEMKDDARVIEEVVVVGYGTQRKVTTTGAVVSTRGADLEKSPSTNLTNSLIGRMPGLTTVSRSGEPGADGATLRIRGSNTLGNNDPLVVVDGVPGRSMEHINPADIESITVLKDASAAIYGSQAANGVIMITTKRGAIGKPKITVGMQGGVNQPTVIPKMANAPQYATMLNELKYYANPAGGRNQQYSANDIELFGNGTDPWKHPNTDWFDAVYKPWSAQNQQNVSISGGNEHTKYFISLGAMFDDAYYKHSATNYKQYNFRSNIDSKINKYINIGFDVSGREEIRDYPTRSVGDSYRMLMRGNPTLPAYWPDGTPGPDIEYGNNPVVTTTNATGYDKDKRYIIESNFRANIIIPWVKGLSVTTNASFDKTIKFEKKFETPWYLYTWDGNADHVLTKGKRGFDAPQLTETMNDGQGLSINAYATYEKTISDIHNIKIMAGAERRSGHQDIFSAFRKNYISPAVDQLFAGASDQYMSNDGSANQNAYQSLFGRVNYDLSKKYLLEFVWRYDGSYKFPESKRYGFFPGVSAGWRMSEEEFWKSNLSVINDFKLRGSWGQTGSDRINEYQYLTTYGFDINKDGKIDGSDNRNYVFGTSEQKLMDEQKIPNPNVTWEVANQTNIGFDAQLLDSKLSVSAEYFHNIRSQILVQRNASVPSSTGLILPPENIGKVQNVGFEGSIGYHGAVGGLQYNVSVNGSYSKNKILFWDETPGIPEYQQSTGRPIGSALYYVSEGIFKDQAQVDGTVAKWAGARPGDVIFKDVNKDGVIDGLDRVMNEKSNMPTFVGGMSINLQYKGIDLSILLQGATGAVQYVSAESGEIGNYYKLYADNRWTPENPSSTYPRAWNRDNEYWRSQSNTFWLQNMNYVRLKNLELGYSLPSKINKAIGVEGFRIYMNGLNLLTLSAQHLIDPETEQGTSYPPQRVVSAGVTITF